MTAIPTRSITSPLCALLEGERTWGSLKKSGGHNGVARSRLVVYPPGLDRADRVALRLWRTFSVWGFGLWLLIEVPLMTMLSPWGAVAVSTVACALAGLAARFRAGRARGHVRTLTVTRMIGAHDPNGVARQRDLRSLTDRLTHADALLASGALTPVEHEAEMWRVYDRMAGTR